jgi:hypothetical protein
MPRCSSYLPSHPSLIIGIVSFFSISEIMTLTSVVGYSWKKGFTSLYIKKQFQSYNLEQFFIKTKKINCLFVHLCTCPRVCMHLSISGNLNTWRICEKHRKCKCLGEQKEHLSRQGIVILICKSISLTKNLFVWKNILHALYTIFSLIIKLSKWLIQSHVRSILK